MIGQNLQKGTELARRPSGISRIGSSSFRSMRNSLKCNLSGIARELLLDWECLDRDLSEVKVPSGAGKIGKIQKTRGLV